MIQANDTTNSTYLSLHQRRLEQLKSTWINNVVRIEKMSKEEATLAYERIFCSELTIKDK